VRTCGKLPTNRQYIQ